jgi:hypothetical protein
MRIRDFRILPGLAVFLVLCMAVAACTVQSGERKPRMVLFIGVDASGSFHNSGDYDNSLSFLARYIYGHLNELGGLQKPRDLFVGSIGGRNQGEAKAFHPIHDFEGKGVAEIEAELRSWFPPTDTLTDFNVFFEQVARITKERNLVLAPITLMIVSDGVPDVTTPVAQEGTQSLYGGVNLDPLEYLSRNVTIRLTYASPKVGDYWRRYVPHKRVRLWTVEAEVMRGWEGQIQPDVDINKQERLWKWVHDNVDYRVRAWAT